MLWAFSQFVRTIPLFFFWPLKSVYRKPGWQSVRVLLIIWALIPFFLLLQASHWIGFFMDALIFKDYRHIAIRSPLFITGIPRSGTTHLQRVLAQHSYLTSMRLWECLFAPSITERKIYSGMAFGAKCLLKLLSCVRHSKIVSSLLKMRPSSGRSHFRQRVGDQYPSFIERFNQIHTLGLNEAEEDFVTLLTVNACFLLVVLFPQEAWYWKLSRFDDAVGEKERAKILAFYRRLVQKHLCFHDGVMQSRGLRYLSKNPSFLPWLNSLREHFPGAYVLLCVREPAAVVASQLSALRPAWHMVQGVRMPTSFVLRLVSMLSEFYDRLLQEVKSLDAVCEADDKIGAYAAPETDQCSGGMAMGISSNCSNKVLCHKDIMLIPMASLVGDLAQTVTVAATFAKLPIDPVFEQYLKGISRKARTYRSVHRYDLSEFSVDWSSVESLFPEPFRR